MVHLADQRDRAAERRRRDQPDALGDCGVVVELQRRAADIARENDGEERADPRRVRGIASQFDATKTRIAAPSSNAAMIARIDPKLSDLRSCASTSRTIASAVLPSIRPDATHLDGILADP